MGPEVFEVLVEGEEGLRLVRYDDESVRLEFRDMGVCSEWLGPAQALEVMGRLARGETAGDLRDVLDWVIAEDRN